MSEIWVRAAGGHRLKAKIRILPTVSEQLDAMALAKKARIPQKLRPVLGAAEHAGDRTRIDEARERFAGYEA